MKAQNQIKTRTDMKMRNFFNSLRQMTLVMATACVALLVGCSKDSMNGGGTGGSSELVAYKHLTINKISCDTLEAVGGIVTPKVDYSYIKITSRNGNCTETEMSTGAEVEFSITGCDWKADEKGNISAGANMTMEMLKNNVDVTVTIGNVKEVNKFELVQRASEDKIIDVSYCMLPIELEEHQCAIPMKESFLHSFPFFYKDESIKIKEQYYTSTQKDGKLNLDWEELATHVGNARLFEEYVNRCEFVSAAGTQIHFHGGEYAQVATFLSGKKDTTIIEQPKYSVSTEYEFVKGERYTETYTLSNGILGYRTAYKEDDKKVSPKSSLNGNVWTIGPIGNVVVKEIYHTITAESNGLTTSLTLRQNDNFVSETLNRTIKWINPEISCNRDEWPDIADYPAGSNPKWLKYDGAWWSEKDNRDLHIDGNRYLDIKAFVHYIICYGAWKFYSGTQEKPSQAAEVYSYSEYFGGMREVHGFKMIAKADVKLKDGSVKHVTHISEWPCLKKPKEFKGSQPCITMEIPVVENAAEDFQWTITFEFNMEEDDYYLIYNDTYLRRGDTNIDEYGQQWKKISYTIWDRLTKISDWEKEVNFGGFVHTSYAPTSMSDSRLGDIIDGVVNPYSEYYKEYYESIQILFQ